MVSYCRRAQQSGGKGHLQETGFPIFHIVPKDTKWRAELVQQDYQITGLPDYNPKWRIWNVIEYVTTISGWPTTVKIYRLAETAAGMLLNSTCFPNSDENYKFDLCFRREIIRTQPGLLFATQSLVALQNRRRPPPPFRTILWIHIILRNALL